MPKTWRFSPYDEVMVRQLSRDLRVPSLVAQVLFARGYGSADEATAFLNAKLVDLHEPNALPGIAEAADRILSAVKQDRLITIYGDYDVDGVTGTSLLWHCLRLAGARVEYYIPHRLDEGYGLNCEALRQLHQREPNQLVVTVDCGITSVQEAEWARQLGLELIVTDHHRMAESLPDAACLVHPCLPETSYPFPHLCGAGVAFKLAWSLCQQLGDGKKASPRMRNFLMGAVGLAAIGTVADVVPLVGENRVLVRYGLSSLVERANPGLQALMKVSGVDANGPIESDDIAFALAPRLNAAGRLGQARLAVELLTTECAERAAALADYLNQLNQNRQTVERRIFKEAKQLVNENPDWQEQPALVLAHRDWHPGVIGIVASRVAERFEKPAILIALKDQGQPGQGSGRSFGNVDLHAGLRASSHHLASFGGHRAAAGLKIAADRVDAFRDEFCRHLSQSGPEVADAELPIDAEVRLADLTHPAVTHLQRLGPFGHHNPRPVFAATRVQLATPPRKMGGGDRHLALKVKHYGKVMRAVAFGRGEWADEIAAVDGTIAISFAANINRYQGMESVELRLIDWQPEH